MRRCARTLVRANGSPLVQGRPLTRGPRDSARTPIPSCEESLAHARTTPLTPNKPPPPTPPIPFYSTRRGAAAGLFHQRGGIWRVGGYGGVPESLGGSQRVWGGPLGFGGPPGGVGGSVLAAGSLGVGSQHGPRAGVGALLEKGSGRRRVGPRLRFVTFGEPRRPRSSGEKGEGGVSRGVPQ